MKALTTVSSTKKFDYKDSGEVVSEDKAKTPPPAPPLKGEGSVLVSPTSAPAQTINGKIKIDNQEFSFAVAPGASVYDAMKQLADAKKIEFSAKEYSGMGYFIEEINGVKNGASNKYWIYSVNGQKAQIGISNYFIKSNDIISWSYENGE